MAPSAEIRLSRSETTGSIVPSWRPDPVGHRVARALADLAAVEVHARHARLRGEGDELHALHAPRPQAELVLGEDDDGAALGRLVGERRELGRLGEVAGQDVGRREELGRLAVAERDRPGLVEEQHVDVAGRLDGAARHREHVVLEDAVHARDADRREQAADGRRDQADEQRDQDRGRGHALRVERERPQRHRRDQEDDRQSREQDRERDLVGRLLARGALDEGDHPVEKGLARVGADLDDDPVRQDARAAGDGGPVAAGLADDRGRLARDRRLVHRGDPLDDGAVTRNDLARFDDDPVALAQARGRHRLFAFLRHASRHRLRAPPAQGSRLGLAASLGHGLGEVGEEQREPEPERDLNVEEDVLAAGHVAHEQEADQDRADQHDEHDRVAGLEPRVELAKRVPDGRADDRAVEQGGASGLRHRFLLRRASRPSSAAAPRWGRARRRERRSALPRSG